ncbi:hypothetical protein FPANT_13821 [Fusarium pseudoanthophilum]|uniref:DUF7924 domain-containing protein n=1 Tax=Fusarium pseudoanthophilum TaxID=48495 RepID=A0A8H5KCH7_9HYPO|nr:hypothetical protein FPANT_13821 [Fusarium pseudoanthophilum]
MPFALVKANDNLDRVQHHPYIHNGEKLWPFDIYLGRRLTTFEEMGPSNADILRQVTRTRARQTVLRDAHEIFKAAIMVQDCSWEEKFLRNIEFNTLGLSEAHVLKNTEHMCMRAFATETESTNRVRKLRSQPDLIYGWIPQRHAIDDDKVSAWLKPEAEAVDGTNMLYPFLLVNFAPDSERYRNRGDIVSGSAFDCLQGASIGVRMVDRLRHRFEACGKVDAGLNSSVFSLVLNRYTAYIYFSYAWDETSEHVHRVLHYNMQNELHQRQFEKIIGNILSWGTTTRLGSIERAIDIIRSNNPSWYPRYQQAN